jgi:hypothetical protein
MRRLGLAVAAVAVLLTAACTTDPAPPPEEVAVAEPPLPSPGTTQMLGVAEITDVADCATRRKPLLRVDSSSVTPSSVQPGSAINHQLVYTLCSKSPASVRGTMSTIISSSVAKVFTNTLYDYELKPGRWMINTNIGIPTAAKPGSYRLDTAFKSRAVTFNDSALFDVEPQIVAVPTQ